MRFSQPVTFATGGKHLDRAAHLRATAEALRADETALVLPFWEGKPLIALNDGWPKLAWLPPVERVLAEGREAPVFLGLYDGGPRFAIDCSHRDKTKIEMGYIAGAKFIDLRSIAGEISPAEATVTATAKGVLGWHQTHGFCARCGAVSVPEEGGWRRACPACGGLHFPRIDPVVIMLITHGDRVLLGRQETWPENLFSLLAGFMEPGETIEDAVRRETYEEAGITVGRVGYVACQPWPFPNSLMLGCTGEALDTDLAIDTQELEDARWIGISELPDILAGKHSHFAAPRVDAIARAMLSAWVAGEIGDFD